MDAVQKIWSQRVLAYNEQFIFTCCKRVKILLYTKKYLTLKKKQTIIPFLTDRTKQIQNFFDKSYLQKKSLHKYLKNSFENNQFLKFISLNPERRHSQTFVVNEAELCIVF